MSTRELRSRPRPQPQTGGISTKKQKAEAPSYSTGGTSTKKQKAEASSTGGISTKKQKAEAPTFLELYDKSQKSHVDWIAEAKKIFNGTALANRRMKFIDDSQEAREQIMCILQEELGEDPKAAVEMLLTGDLEDRFVAKIATYVYIKIKEVLKFTFYLLCDHDWDVEIAGLLSDTIKTEIDDHLGLEVSELKSLADLAEEVRIDTSRWMIMKLETLRDGVKHLQCEVGSGLEDIVEQWSKEPIKTLSICEKNLESDKDTWYCKMVQFGK